MNDTKEPDDHYGWISSTIIWLILLIVITSLGSCVANNIANIIKVFE